MYKFYYINLDRSIDRKNQMEKQLNDLSFNYMRIKGVDGKLIENKYFGMIDNIKYNIDNENHITPFSLKNGTVI